MTCKRCGRTMRNPSPSGYGPVCERMVGLVRSRMPARSKGEDDDQMELEFDE